ncbi:SLC13 family permease [Paradesulfitobacterium ferrireducens]|uniref:SLC13 family permease n=1 Tax=Paradesulfitobacterium ferrireducens TaxID=2816476 RepID=UPI001A8D6164|nr:DASS family sodium-coupled anion symporter [Paradesulfitobacterium ferrireducens]
MSGLTTPPQYRKVYIQLSFAAVIFIVIAFGLSSNLSWSLRATAGMTAAAIWLWVLEPIPMPLTAVMYVTGLPILGAASLETALGGFASGSTFLIMAGFMMAQGVNSTSLGKRFANLAIIRFGGSVGGVLAGVLLAPQLLSIFIPATGVRTTMLLPALLAVVNSMGLRKNSNTAKLLVLGLSFGTSISGVGLLPAAIANVLTVDLMKSSLGMQIYYFEWFKLTWPAWLLMIPITWFIMLKIFPPEVKLLEIAEIERELKELGSLSKEELKCIGILSLTVLLWMTESIHHLPTAVPALLGVVLMGLPGTGIVGWDKLKEIDWGTVLLMGATLSLASAINKSGAAELLARKLLDLPGVEAGLSLPLLTVAILALLTHVYHLGVTNVSTVVLTLTPVILQITLKLGINPLLAAVTINISAMLGFLLVVETLPGVITYATGVYSPQDLMKVGIWLTLAAILVVILTAVLWWPIIGLT